MLTKEDVLAAYDYDRETGTLRFKDKWKTFPKGSVVGSLTDKGYLRCWVGNRQYRVHRLIWLIEHGESPRGEIDHIDGVKTNNQICNLRDVSSAYNQQNRKSAKGYYKTKSGKFRVDLYFNGIKRSVGLFLTEEEAHNAYLSAKEEHYAGFVP